MGNVRFTTYSALILVLLSASHAAAASTSFHSWGKVAGGYPTRTDTTDNGPTIVVSPNTHRWEYYSGTVTPGALEAQGVATFSDLKVSVMVEGLSAEHGGCDASFNDYWTVTHPALNGTQGTMQLAFDVTGNATVLDYLSSPLTGDDSFATVSLDVFIDDTSVLDMDQSLEMGSVAYMGVGGSPTVTAPFAFTYGDPFKVGSRLRVFGDPDNVYLRTTWNPFHTHYGGGTVSHITLDFMNTATLRTIAIPGADGLTGLQTQSGVDHQSLMGSAIIPEPTSALVVLCTFGIPFLSGRHSRSRGAT